MKKILDRLKKVFSKEKIFSFWNKKRNRIIFITILVIVLIVFLVLILTNKKNKFALNEIYNFYPAEVRKLYSNLVDVSCSGDFHLDIDLDAGSKKVSEMSKENLLDYVFSNLDKDGRLKDEFDIALINDAQKRLFMGDIKPFDGIKTYKYGNYEYTLNGRTITRKVRKCTSDNNYVLHLYGYSDNKKGRLSMDVNVGYLKDGILYDYHDNRLGEYDGDVSKLPKLMTNTTYYRFIYYRNNNTLKLDSVEHKSRS